MRRITFLVALLLLNGCAWLQPYFEVDPETGSTPFGEGAAAAGAALKDVGGGAIGWIIGGVGALVTGVTVAVAAKTRGKKK